MRGLARLRATLHNVVLVRPHYHPTLLIPCVARKIPHHVPASFRNYPRTLHSSSPIASSPSPSRDFKLTDIGEGIVQVELTKWHVKPGDVVREFDVLCEVQSDKATVEITSRYAGKIEALGAKEGEMVRVGNVLVKFAATGEDAAPAPPPTPQPSPLKQLPQQQQLSPTSNNNTLLPPSNAVVFSTPAVRHIAKENNVNLANVTGTGKAGRITKEDVLTYLSTMAGKLPSPPQPLPSIPKPSLDKYESIPPSPTVVVPLRGIKKEMSKAMTMSLTIPHMGLMDEIRVGRVLDMLKGRKDNLSLLSVLIKATSCALLRFPEANAATNTAGTELYMNPRHNLGIAMDTPKGLMVPVIYDVHEKSVMDISKEVTRLRELAMEGKLTMEHLTGPTFTLSNIGSLGGSYACPVIVPPQVAIGAFGRSRRVPMYVSDTSDHLVPTHVMPVSWSADHRVLDGATVARFGNAFKVLVESPEEMAFMLK